ncbi:molybdenum ABC transporter ATP-binding protein [Dasania marina]|uniref:molybdenum ABC transporter ATP-binding protein n=1 Tax=Dasania marina TaxID=471499 RepID=UPI00038223B0|nr:molybdenum ABC transporter ATP-binding protein [Dasania marina]
MSLSLAFNLQRDRLSLNIKGELANSGITALYGDSGAGKTSLLRCIAGLEQGAQGSIRFNNTIWQDDSAFIPSHQRHIGYVFQDARLFPHLNVLQNLHYAYQRCHNKGSSYSLEQICAFLKLDHLLSQYPATLSGGEQQRVAIGRALLSQPQLLLMDEPLSALDQASRDEILDLLEQLPQQVNVPVIYVSHNMDEVSRLADHLVILEQGEICAQGPLLELCHRLDLRLNQQEQAASLLQGKIIGSDSQYQLAELSIGAQQSLWLHCQRPIGEQLRLRIPARDVSISLSPQRDSSILNILPGCIVSILHQDNAAHAMVKLQVAEQYLLARITYKSLEQLQLAPGLNVYAQIKSVALLNQSLEA